ncbi:Glycosyltransferase, GT2 family [Fibrobacter sp. UWB8]|uniref:glycosyltransferase family 2 protein n=1 Tax=Fibrobacter sp. UWB8 TaxID=1896207 RepID=UPI000920EA75|nr:glycosyltransferase family 2 protein [Fibrobacter sp. UWB8]SHG37558.1 Glycosyltransferase, GT2 family [Fibrobacter sp. UWB8]
MKDKVLAIIVTYNAMQWITKCIHSAMESEIPLDLFVIDNKSTDDTVQYIKKNFPSITLVQSKANLGFGAANNIGLQYALDHNYSYVYLLNQDAWIKPNTIRLLIEANRATPQYGILSPIQVQSNEKELDKNFSLIFPKNAENAPLVSVNSVMAAHWLISRKCLLEVGGFSPTFQHYGEDDNYCGRALHKGFKIGIVTTAFAIHDRSSRIITASQKLYNSYVRTLVYLSGFEKTTAFALYGFLCDCTKYLFKEHSLLFITYIKKILLNFRLIKKNKKISISRTAFLHNKD